MNGIKEFFKEAWLDKSFGDRLFFLIPLAILALILSLVFGVFYKVVLAVLAMSFMKKMIVAAVVGILVSYAAICWFVP